MAFRFSVLGILFIVVCAVSPARGQAPATYVSHTGNNANPCSLSLPCQDVAYAITQTAAGGSLSCLDAPSVAVLITIDRSITIDCAGVNAIIVHTNPSPLITINLPQSDAIQSVRLRGLTINGKGEANTAVEIQAAGTVILEDMNITAEAQFGVHDIRTTAGKLRVANTSISQTKGAAIAVAGAARNAAIIDNVTLDSNLNGVTVAAFNKATIIHSDISNNSGNGVQGDADAFVIVDGSTISSNASGIVSNSSVRLSNNNIAFNNRAIGGASGTYGNNRFSGNTTIGTAPTPLGGASSDVAQQ